MEKIVFVEEKEEKTRKIHADDIKFMDRFGDVLFTKGGSAAYSGIHVPKTLYHKVIELSDDADWVLGKWGNVVVLVPLKKKEEDC